MGTDKRFILFTDSDDEECWIDCTATPFYSDPLSIPAERRLEFYQHRDSDTLFYGVNNLREEMVEEFSDHELYNRIVIGDFEEASRLFPEIHVQRRMNRV